ncbi:hypothetical protein CsatB_014807 [Cannabis sativa]
MLWTLGLLHLQRKTYMRICVKFSNFIDENIVMNRGVKKYSDADNMLSPPMDFSFIEISEKMWFYQLHACGEFSVCDSHLDVVFYYLRKKIKQHDTLNQRITTTDCLFDQVIWLSYNQFLKSGSNPSKIDFDNVIPRYIVGDLVEGPYSVGKREPLNFKFIDGLPSQVNSDCGVFVIKFADFIRGKIDDIPSKMSDLVAVYRDDLAVSLFIHARRKQIGGYITDDEVLKKVKKSKDNASDKAKVKGKDIAKGKGKGK